MRKGFSTIAFQDSRSYNSKVCFTTLRLLLITGSCLPIMASCLVGERGWNAQADEEWMRRKINAGMTPPKELSSQAWAVAMSLEWLDQAKPASSPWSWRWTSSPVPDFLSDISAWPPRVDQPGLCFHVCILIKQVAHITVQSSSTMGLLLLPLTQ